MAGKKKEMVDHPAHYNTGEFEVIDVIEDWELGFNDGNAVKYIGRWRTKHDCPAKKLEDLNKAEWYIRRQIEQYKKELARQERREKKLTKERALKKKPKPKRRKK